jgi:PAS domain S-box-containing protein
MEKVTFRASASPHTMNGSDLHKSNPIDARQQDSPQLRAFIDSVPALSWSALPDGSLDFFNKQFQDYTGLSSDQLSGLEWKSAIHPADIQKFETWWKDLLHSPETDTTEVRLRRFDGSPRWFLIFANPARDESGNVVKWYGTNIDIDDRKRVEEIMRAREESWLQIVDNIPGLVATMGATGEVEFLNRQTLEYFGKSTDDLKNWALSDTVHPDDLPRVIQARIKSIEEGGIYDIEHRCRRADGVYRWFKVRGLPARDAEDTITAWYLLLTDIDDLKRAEEALQSAERNLAVIVNTIPTAAWASRPDGYCDFLNQVWLDYTGVSAEKAHGWGWVESIHPDDRKELVKDWQSCLASASPVDTEARIRRFDGSYRWFLIRANPLREEGGNILKWYGTCIDIEDRKRREEVLRTSELSWRQIIDNIPGLVNASGASGDPTFFNRQELEYFGKTNEELKDWGRIDVFHPEDLPGVVGAWATSLETGQNLDIEARLRRADGVYRWFQTRAVPARDAEGKISDWYALHTDIEDRKSAEEKLRQSEGELRTITDAIRQSIIVLTPDGTTLYANRVACEYSGLTVDEVIKEGSLARICHPDDINRVREERRVGLLEGVPFDLEMRFLHKSGQDRWNVMQYNPLKDESGQIIRWYATATDIDDRKKAEERLRNENVKLAQERVYLEEQIRSEMGFEQIIGSSPALQRVLELVETVAPNDSTVLLLGETGTGKELIARAVHERSRRKAKTFAKLNCAAIPTGLLESELFGHEKGAFTGAIIQKAGRMELADQGTLFLDEVGDIPIDIQPKLLRALQEKEFERLGSTHTRKVNVRLVAATNRNLEKMVADREFRSDLFYRLNVFPIRIPPLRERKDDIPLLVTYFVQKFAKQMQKRIDSVPVATMKALTAWDWPGNIRELENFIERAVILTRGESLAAPLAELRKVTTDEPVRESAPKTEVEIVQIVRDTIASLKRERAPSERTKKQHDEIVRALTECKGRVGGADGAAVRMGLSRTTLMYRMKKLGINPYDYE